MDFPRKEVAPLDVNKDIVFQITDWFIPENDKNRKKPESPEEAEFYNMVIYGVTQDGATVSTRITGYEPYFFVKPPPIWETYNKKKFQEEVNKINYEIQNEKYLCKFKDQKYFKKICPYGYEEHVNELTVVTKKDFWGFTNGKDFRFIKVSVRSLYMFNNLRYYFESLVEKGFKMYESNIDPFLRYIHEKNINPCGWITVTDFQEESEEDYQTRCDYNIVVDYESISPITINNIAPMLIASFDIECTSSHGDFPVAKKDYRKVAQDLAMMANANYKFTTDLLLYCIETIFSADAKIDDDITINRVHPKNPINFENVKPKLLKEMDKIIAILNEISDISENTDESEDEEKEVKPMTVKQRNILEGKLNTILTSILPPLKGDEIIQIGTTVHRYGSDDIIYRNIISLNTCNKIQDTDVISCKTEKQLLMEWKNLMIRLNPDILTGYNIFGFDMEYMWVRAIENGISNEFVQGIGRNIGRKSELITQKLSSSALGDNELKYFDLDGTVVIDLLKVMQRDHKLDSYKLDNVAQVFIGDKKDDLKPHEIFQKFKGSAADRCVIAKYCIQDCALVNKIIHKLKIMENNVGMANVCLVPLNYLFKRGQGIKIFSLVAKQCMDRNHLIPTNKYSNMRMELDADGYEGAVVLEPKEGIYLNDPIVVFDYGSLYPSSMIARNLSHDCYVMDEKYMVENPNIEYKTVSYDLYEGKGDKKKKIGVKECIFAQYKDGKKGIIPDILGMLLQERKNTRKLMEYQTIITNDNKKHEGIVVEKDTIYEISNIKNSNIVKVEKKNVKSIHDTYNNFEKDVFDALQLAYKITANSLYGQIGAKTSPIYLKDIAACTTATGREMIMLAKDFVETNYNAEVIYGDSVMPYTPITYKTGDDEIYVSTFENLEGHWQQYTNFKPDDPTLTHKEQYIPVNKYVWTNKGWSKIRRIIRHKTIKKIYRIVTKSGIVDVTADHSLLDHRERIIKPVDCELGMRLLHSQPSFTTKEENNNINVKKAYLYGKFMRKGSIHEYSGLYSWKIGDKSLEDLEMCKGYLEETEQIKFKIYKDSTDTYVVQPENINDAEKLVHDYRKCYLKNDFVNNIKTVPHDILNSSHQIIESFIDGVNNDEKPINFKHDVTAQSYIVLCQMVGKPIDLFVKNHHMNTENDKIKSFNIIYDNYFGYVYDIETESGVFHGGVGNIILKNTDSIFCKFPLKDEDGVRVYGKDSLKYAIEIGKHVEKNIVSIMPKPQKLNYEKSLYPFILFSKKRYVGNLYEFDTTKFKQKSMGIVLKRRDNAPIVKKIFGGVIDILLNKQDLNESIQFLREELDNLVNGKTPIQDLIISKSLRGAYKDPTKIPHKVLADRIGARDPGNKPQVNERVPFVYIKVPDAKLQGDRIENPDYIIENNLTPDYLHYITNQIMNPVLQLYTLCLEELPNYNKEVSYWKEVENELKKKPLYVDDVKRANRLANLKTNMTKELLFQESIDKLSEPVVKKKGSKTTTLVKDSKKIVPAKTTATIKSGDELNEVKVLKKSTKQPQKVTTDNDTTDILKADIKVTKKTGSNNIESIGKIYGADGKKIIWKYENKEGKDKTNEIIPIIMNMIEFIKKENKKLLIKINFKQFITDFNNSIVYYNEFEGNKKCAKQAIENEDVGLHSHINSIIRFENLLKNKQHFSIDK